MRELSSHLTRDKAERDAIEEVLKGWGDWRARTEFALGTGSNSPIAGVIGETTGRLYGENKEKAHKASLEKYAQIRLSLLKNGFSDENATERERLKNETTKLLKEWKARIQDLSQPKESIVTKPKTPGYNGNRFYAKIDQIIASLPRNHRAALVNKYEKGWEIKDFMEYKKWGYGTAKTRISEARKEFKKIYKSGLKKK